MSAQLPVTTERAITGQRFKIARRVLCAIVGHDFDEWVTLDNSEASVEAAIIGFGPPMRRLALPHEDASRWCLRCDRMENRGHGWVKI